MIEKTKVKEIVEAYFPVSDLYLTDIQVEPGNRIVVEIDSDTAVSIDDCVALTRFIESQLNRDAEDYELEVGSAGISQTFKVLRQYKKNIGREIEVLSKAGKKQTGILESAGEEQFVIRTTKQVKLEGAKRKSLVEEDITFRYDEIKFAKCVIKI
ncbi:MAG: ribosome assembly cofactor RimP [Dysgonamonadaceae bacterium]|jgi:ribosome maturation factor RimP|nr:ribosome assembly cofactor RimP [Dysgonamonadaceae bacterium]